MKIRIGMMVLLMGLLCTMSVIAEDTPVGQGEAEVQWGPPEELKQMDGIIGEWTYTGLYQALPTDTNWVEHTSEVVYSYVAGGGAIMMDYRGMMMGMEMYGVGLISYDRELKEWQHMWVDNFVGRQSYYTGSYVEGKHVASGIDLMNGKEVQTRITTYDIAEDSFRWMMENSMDGKSWFVSMKGEYTRK